MSHPHYAHIRYLGLNGRIKGTNEAPLRIHNGTLAVKCKGFIMPVVAIEDGFAVVDVSDKANTALATTPKTLSGSWDFNALDALAPVIANPWDVPELAGVKTVGTKADVAKPKASQPIPRAKTTIAIGTQPTTTKTTPKASAKPAEPVSTDAVIAYLASLSGTAMTDIIAKLNEVRARPAATPLTVARGPQKNPSKAKRKAA